MFKNLYELLSFLLSTSINRALTGAGLTLTTSYFIRELFDKYLSEFLASLNSISSIAINLLNIAGVDVALSIIISGMITKVTINSMKLRLFPSRSDT